MTEGGKRRDGILSLLEESDTPLSGTELAHRFKVSRQVIVQDIALLRAEDKKILSTYRGYVLDRESEKKRKCIRVFCVYNAQPLKVLTGDYHYHTVTAESEKNLDFIEQELRKKGYLKEE